MAAAAAETSEASTAGLALAEANINWERLDKTRFHVIGAILFTAQQGALHPTAVVKTRMQVAEGGLSHMSGFAVFRRILRSDGIPGIFRGFGTSAVGALPGRVLALTSLEVSKEMALKYSEHLDMSEASKIAVANGIAGLVSSIFSSSYFVPLDVICQRLMVQGLPGMPIYRGPFDVINKVVRTEGLRGLYRGFGITMLTQSPASALWWSAYGGAQHAIWRSLGYGNDSQKKPSQTELVAVQATAGTIAGACSSIITTPIDTIKTRLQLHGGRHWITKLRCCTSCLVNDGLVLLYKIAAISSVVWSQLTISPCPSHCFLSFATTFIYIKMTFRVWRCYIFVVACAS